MKDQYLNTAIKIVKSSGNILSEYFEKIHDYKQKNENIRDLVTEVDLIAEKNAIAIIEDNFPNHNVYGEETGLRNKDSKFCWYIDPLDGTVNYSQGIPICAISIGLKYDNEIIVGSIYNPFTEELFFASKGEGAFLNGKRIEVSKKDKLETGLYVAAFSSEMVDLKNSEYKTFGKINDLTRGVLRLGSAALALAYLSCGRIDGFWGKNLKPWDIAGGIILVNESGGQINQNNLELLTKEKDSLIIASNSLIHNQFVDVISKP